MSKLVRGPIFVLGWWTYIIGTFLFLALTLPTYDTANLIWWPIIVVMIGVVLLLAVVYPPGSRFEGMSKQDLHDRFNAEKSYLGFLRGPMAFRDPDQESEVEEDLRLLKKEMRRRGMTT